MRYRCQLVMLPASTHGMKCVCTCNRQVAAALGAMQAVTAWVLVKGMQSGAVAAGPYSCCTIALMSAGACFCWSQAATANSQQQWQGSVASSAAGSVLSNSMQLDAQPAAAGTGSSWQSPAVPRVLQMNAGVAECFESFPPLSSAECERREHAEPEYAAFTSATVLLLTLLQLAL